MVRPSLIARGRQNQLGQAMGVKGTLTRRRLLAAIEDLLKITPLRELRVAQVVRAANTSTATFYVYFDCGSQAVLERVGEVTQSSPRLLSLFGESWPADQAPARAHNFVEEYVENWRAHEALFRVRNLASEEGQPAFAEARVNAISPLINQMAIRIRERQANCDLPAELDAIAAAAALLAMIERAAVVRVDLPGRRVGRTQLYQVAEFFAALLLGGTRAVLGIYGMRAEPDRALPAVNEGRPKTSPTPIVLSAQEPATADNRNLDGQVMGRKGAQTRLRLIRATEELLRTRGLLDLSIADISRAAGTAPSAFYRYFHDVPGAILAVLEGAPQGTEYLCTLLAGPWEGNGGERARLFTEGYIALWQENSALFRVRNLAADEGDVRFDIARLTSLGPLLRLLEDGAVQCQRRGAFPAQVGPLPASGAFLGMLERLSVAPNVLQDPGAAVSNVAGAAAYFLQVLMVGVQDALPSG
jgi:AcrR family transcriptional regulator